MIPKPCSSQSLASAQPCPRLPGTHREEAWICPPELSAYHYFQSLFLFRSFSLKPSGAVNHRAQVWPFRAFHPSPQVQGLAQAHTTSWSHFLPGVKPLWTLHMWGRQHAFVQQGAVTVGMWHIFCHRHCYQDANKHEKRPRQRNASQGRPEDLSFLPPDSCFPSGALFS